MAIYCYGNYILRTPDIFKEGGHYLSRGVHFNRVRKGLYGKEKKAIMALEKSPNPTLSIYGMAIYGKYHYYFGTPDFMYQM